MKTKMDLGVRLETKLRPSHQLTQAIKILQIPTYQLEAKIKEILDKNPLLEIDDNKTNNNAPIYNGNVNEVELCYEVGLKQYLMSQLHIKQSEYQLYYVCETIINSLNDDGYLNLSLEEIKSYCCDKFIDIDFELIQHAIKIVQSLEPTGVAARNLNECLILQLNAFYNHPQYDLAYMICENYLDILANNNIRKLQSKIKSSCDITEKAIALIRKLNPKPGATYNQQDVKYNIPDVIVKKHNNEWKIFLNNNLPQIKIAGIDSNIYDKTSNDFIKEKMQEAKWLLNSVERRNSTLMKVSNAIMESQKDFLEKGQEYINPLRISEIATLVGLHDSSISRITNNKYILTPHGMFELKYFFSSMLSDHISFSISANAIKAKIAKFIDNEDKDKPLSDSKIANLLKLEGITVARRTISKYRESMGILPSNKRKKCL